MKCSTRSPAVTARVLALLILLLPTTGCSHLFWDKRTTYNYKPDYGVDNPQFRRSLEVLGTEMVPENKAVLLENGAEFFPAMLEAIRAARASVNMEMFIFNKGKIAAEFAEVLAAKAREGIEVRVLLDDWGSHPGELEDVMTRAGVKLKWYKPVRIYSIYKVGNRTHRKILTIDGHIGFMGGVGIDDRWMGNASNPNEWRETMVRVEGPVVAQLQSIFTEDWVHTTGEVLHGEKQFPPTPAAGELLAQAISASRSDASSMAKLLYYMAIQAARKSIWIENAYFVPDGQIRRGLVHAAERGVDVRVIVPGPHIDIPIVRMASRHHYGELLDGGVKMYEYQPTMIHNKVMVVDGIWTTIGSINFVNRSMKKNAEANVAIYDRGFAGIVEKSILADLEKSQEFTKRMWKKRGFLSRMGEIVFWLFSENY
ncbi:MAG: phospholipase D-like domain-containing protein [Acidobacteriota bacterium]